MTLHPTNLLPLLDIPDGKRRTRKLIPRKKRHLTPVNTDRYPLIPHQHIPFYSLECMFTMVISDDGWSWALAWRQLGVLFFSCYPLSKLASNQLIELSRHVPGLIKAQGLDSQTRIVCGNIGSFTDD
jgi:hypothetical protein